ncbi:MAG: 2-dehydropantoate 2-reductase [Burkholderiaceae bacterium]
MMKVGVVGLGAVGGLFAARLDAAGHRVWALVRETTAAAVREHGLVFTSSEGETSVHRIEVATEALALAPPDLLIIALKAQVLAEEARSLVPLIGPDTLVLPTMNGVPWWFLGGDWLASVDPQGHIGTSLPLAQTVGAVVHLSSTCPAPGHCRHVFGERLILGEPSGGVSPRVNALAEELAMAGFATETSVDIRSDIWFKLWGNMTMNPISALTGAACDAILDDELVQGFMRTAMAEAAAVGERIGCPIAQSVADRIAVTRKLGAFKTSMLQDAEASRPLEIDALIGAVHEIARRVGVPTPNIDALFGLVRVMARSRGLVTSGG